MAQAMSAGDGGGAGQFGDTTMTKVFVGGLAWETNKEGVRGYFEQFGEILEAVVITDKNTARSKGYGFVTFREPEGAMKACLDPYPVIDGRRANCNLAYLGVQNKRSTAATGSLQPYVPHVHGGSNMRALLKSTHQTAAIAAATGGGGGASLSFQDHGIQQGIPATYSVYGYSPYFSDYSYSPLTYYQTYGGLGGAQYQAVFNGAAAAAAAGLTMADPTGLYPYFQYGPASAAAGYSMMQYPQMYQYAAAVGAPTTTTASPTAVAGLQQYGATLALNPNSTGQAAGMPMSQLTAPSQPAPTPQYHHYRLISSHLPAAAAPAEKPLA